MPTSPKDHQPKRTSASAWQSKAGAKPQDVELPSGNVALLRQIPITDMLAQKMFPDSLSSIISEKVGQGTTKDAKSKGKDGKTVVKEPSNDDIKDVMGDPDKILELFDLFDKVLASAVVEPKVKYHKEDSGEVIDWADRDDEFLYTDQVDLEDKLFIFNYCIGGSKDLERFRTEFGDALGGMEAVSGV